LLSKIAGVRFTVQSVHSIPRGHFDHRIRARGGHCHQMTGHQLRQMSHTHTDHRYDLEAQPGERTQAQRSSEATDNPRRKASVQANIQSHGDRKTVNSRSIRSLLLASITTSWFRTSLWSWLWCRWWWDPGGAVWIGAS